jgi:hypothetical protein
VSQQIADMAQVEADFVTIDCHKNKHHCERIVTAGIEYKCGLTQYDDRMANA